MTNDERNPKPECRKTLRGAFAGFVIRISSFLRISSFVIRILRIEVCSIKRPVRGLVRAAGGGSVHGKPPTELPASRSSREDCPFQPGVQRVEAIVLSDHRPVIGQFVL